MENNESVETKKYAVDMMIEATKQLITISTASIVVTVSLIKLIIPDFTSVTIENIWLISTTWILLVASILSGIVALGGVSYSAYEKNKYDLSSKSIKYPMCLQQLLFVCAIIFFIRFAYLTISNQTPILPSEEISQDTTVSSTPKE
ncbi:hypothetical protein ACEWBD_21085 [Vibrio parahaemolyticus]|uniref:hypothetical protein n=1 Tax=Vibrio parahaemolyticus TaxID=670 RepID=UPI001F3A941D|nr:hypothetical protein [Vibrio parahaemolyticus]MCG0031065.1 hypothetical protein [Vibrio parahaemolyticus]